MSADLFHKIEWTAATLSEKPLSFRKVVFVVREGIARENETISTYSTQLAMEGYAATVVTNLADIIPLLTPKAEALTVIIHIPQVARTREEVYDAVVSSCNSLIVIAQSLVSRNEHNGSCIDNVRLFSLVTKDEYNADGELSYAPLYGLARALKMEIPGIFGGLFETENKAMGFPLSAIKYALGFDVVRVCQDDEEQRGVPLTAALQPISVPLSNRSHNANVQLNPEATYLTTGGTRGIGLEIASWMVAHGARHLLLVARNSVNSQGDQSLFARIAELKAQGAAVHVLAIDLSQRDAETSLRREIARLQVPPIKGIVHAAGVAGYHTLENCTPGRVAEGLSPKVRGALSLDALFPPGTLDFFALISSVGQLVGFPGQLSYAPSNSFLDELAIQRRREGDNATSIQWTAWRGVGLAAQSKSVTRMVAKGMKDRGIAYISQDEALSAWESILTLNTDQVAVVRALELEATEPLRHPILKNITPRRSNKGHVHSGLLSDYPEHAVAVVAMACRTAAGDTPDELWQALESGKSTVREPDPARFSGVLGQTKGKGKLWGNFLPGGIQSFDHKFFDKSKREATALDPHQRLLLETTYQALEAAGWADAAPETHENSSTITGCFIGMNSPDYVLNQGSHPPSPYTGGGMMRSFVAGRLSHYFGWTGPSHIIDTACSSAMVAIHQACRALQVGECTQAVAGGANLISNMVLFEAMRVGGFLSSTGACRTFDARADGYCRGEAVGIVLLKPLHRALEDGDEIHGVLLATGNNQNLNNTSITNPVLESQKALYRDVLARAHIHPSNVSYVEAHGTATRAGDPVEMEAIRQVVGGSDRQSVLYVGSMKPSIGHTEAASGVISLIKVMLMMKHNRIPAQVQFEKLNSSIPPLGLDRMRIATALNEWEDHDNLRLALVNSYGASGSNAAAVVAPPPRRACTPESASSELPKSSAWPIFISAASEPSIRAYCDRLAEHVSENRHKITLAQLAFALATKKSRRFKQIISTTATSMDDLHSQLRSPQTHVAISKPIVLLFGGQNGNTIPSARSLYESSSLFRSRLQECEKVMHSLGLPSPVPAVLAGTPSNDDNNLVLHHAALFSLQYASAMSWIDSGITPQAICGHSFGEWTALTVSGALSLEAGIKLVTGITTTPPISVTNEIIFIGRASIIQRLWGDDAGSMVAIEVDLVAMNKTPEDHLEPFRKVHPRVKIDVACYNGPNNYVVAGTSKDIDVLVAYLQTQKQKCKSLGTSSPQGRLRFKVLTGMHAYHCHMVDTIVNECAALSASIPLQTPTLPFETCHRGKSQEEQVYGQVNQKWTEQSNFIANNTRGPVYFGDAIQRIVARLGAPCTFLEAGIGSPIITMAQNALTARTTSVRDGHEDYEHTFISIGDIDPRRSLAEATAMLWRTGSTNAQCWLFHRSQRASFLTPQGYYAELPPYQFERHCHWLEYNGRNSNTATNGDPQANLADGARHDTELAGACPHCHKSIADIPYIVREKPLSVPRSESRFTFKIDTRNARYQELVSGHAVVGTPICPAVMYLEMAAYAVLLLQSKDMREITINDVLSKIVIENLEIRAPLGLDPGGQRAVKLALTKHVEREDRYRFELFSASKDNETHRSTVHSIGDVTAVASLNELCKENEEHGEKLWTRASHLLHSEPDTDALRGAMVYKVFAAMAQYSAPYQRLKHIVSKGSECAGEIAMPAGNESVADVLLVDNFMQVAGAYMHSLRYVPDAEEHGQGESMAYICTGLGTVAPLTREPGSAQHRVYTSLVREEGRDAMLDVFAFHCGSRMLVWSVRGVKFTRIPRSSLVKSLALAKSPNEQQQQKEQQQVAISSRGNGRNDNSNNINEQEVLAGVKAVLSRSLDMPAAEITAKASVEDLGIDSLVSPEILLGISDRFQVDIPVADFAGISDVATLCGIISSRGHGEKQAAAIAEQTFVEVLSRSLDLEPAEIDMASNLEDLGVDSLVAPEIVNNLNAMLNVDISMTDFAEAVDVTALCQLARGSSVVTESASNNPAHGQSRNSEYLHEAFLQVRRGFDTYGSAAGFIGFWDKIYPQQLCTVAAFIVEAFDKLGCSIGSCAPGKILPAIKGIPSKYEREMSCLWQILMEAGIVEQEVAQDSYIRGPAAVHNASSNSAQKQSTELINDFPTSNAAHRLLAHLGPHLAECLIGELDPVSVLFGTDEGRRLLEDFYGDAPDFLAANGVLSDFLSSAITSHASISPASPLEPFHILEIGAGTGGTTKHLVPVLQATGLPFTYTFTDISASLVARASKSTFKEAVNMEFLKLDVTEAPPIHLQGRYHAVISMNCMHATPNMRQSLTNIYRLVRDGEGCVALLELTQRSPWYDLVWGLLDGWWLHNDDRDYPLQAPWVWEAAMRDAGFGHVDWSEGRSRESRSMRVIVGFATPEVPLNEKDKDSQRDLDRRCSAKASSLLIHRGLSTSTRNLFLVPGGRGLGSIFIPFGKYLARLETSLSISIYALNAPSSMNKAGFSSENEIIALEEYAAACVADIKRRQPQGPYMVGGYSFGGVVGFEMTRQLLEAGDEVEKLVLIDTACPIRPTWFPDSVLELIFSTLPPELKIGIQSDNLEALKKEASSRVKNKEEEESGGGYDFSIDIKDSGVAAARIQMKNYQNSPLPGRKMPLTILVSARRGMVSGGKDIDELGLDPELRWIANWLSNDRDGGPLGWDQLMGAENVTVIRADSDHYGMMQMPPGLNGWVSELVEVLGA
ncbi:BcPKS20, polyketide synthase [Aspergillus californicus]